MELRQLKYFLKTRELLSFTAASAALFITQSTLSQQIKQLEDEIGVPLFDRMGKRIRITEAGEMFAVYAADSVRRANDGMDMLKELNGLKTGKFIVGVSYGLRDFFLPVITSFALEFPNIDLRIICGTSDWLKEKLASFELDQILVFGENSSHAKFDYIHLFHSPLTFVSSRQGELANMKSISLGHIVTLPLAIATMEGSNGHFLGRLFDERNLTPRFHIEINDIPSVLKLVKSSKWYTIMVKVTVQDSELICIPIKEEPQPRRAQIITNKLMFQKKVSIKIQELLIAHANSHI